MAKPSNGNKTAQNASQAAATTGQEKVADVAFSLPADDISKGIEQVRALLQEAYPNENIDEHLADFFKTEVDLADPASGRLLINLPEDINEGIAGFVEQLKAAYPGVDVDEVLADLYKTDAGAVINEDNGNVEVAPVKGFQMVFPLDALADNITQGLLAVQSALDNRTVAEGETFPEALVGYQFSQVVLERYIQGVLHQEIRLEDVELVIADAAVDSHLRTLNFSRLLQGLDPTHFYLRFL